MFQSIVPLLANLFVTMFAIDAGLSLIEELVRATTGSAALMPLRDAIAAVVVVGCIANLFALALTPRLPVSVILPMVVTGLWLNLGRKR